MEHVILDRLRLEDIPDLVALSDHLGWTYTAEELTVMLSAGCGYGHRNEAGRMISSAMLLPYGTELASIGAVMVDADYRRRGLGQQATQACIEALSERSIPIMLVATKQGKPLYERMGFRTVGTLDKLICEAGAYRSPAALNLKGYRVEPLQIDRHLTAMVQLDRAAVGGDREQFLRLRAQQAQIGAVLLDRLGEVAGFSLGIQNPVKMVIGPVVAPDGELAAALVDSIAREQVGKLRIDVPSEQKELLELLNGCGFACVNVPPVMLLHAEELPNRDGTLYGIAAQAYG